MSDDKAHRGTTASAPRKATIIIARRPKRSEARPKTTPPRMAPTIIMITILE